MEWLSFAAGALPAGLVYVLLKSRINGLVQKTNAAEMALTMAQTQLTEKKAELEKAVLQFRSENQKVINLHTELSKTETDLYHLKKKLSENSEELASLRTTFLQQFHTVSNEVLVHNSEHFKKASAENIERILEPLKERIKEFEAKVETTYEKSLIENTTLKEQIAQLVNLNQQMSKDALNLTNALKGERKTQGNWGEYLLESLLEKSGLEREIHYRREDVRRDAEQKIFRPDVIIMLPDDKHLVIDSKLSLVAYEAYCSAEDELVQQLQLKNHLNSLRTHYSDLSRKNYQHLHGINSPDFVLMYIPIEPAFNLAMQQDREMFVEALDRNIVFVTNSTLLATLRTVASVWKQENQKRNVLRIAEESGKLYDKFVGFVDDMKDIGLNLERSQQKYNLAMKKLSEGNGNLIKKAELLKKLGAKTSKTLDTRLVQKDLPEPTEN
ncbi:DNA recombination protein RmuC [Adhaeribacter soli]|uniref:DNA recombination protein RmuC n=1 Tax=Adhaeribacter soli TaxID=2607655 RepID=A0A5N1J568_9BACT|nr:DNA recombination protein RmuC [Adhaeribacter soli]KAA9346056.1 DNA recombination protein RmuC [Adhaeribacter soli]